MSSALTRSSLVRPTYLRTFRLLGRACYFQPPEVHGTKGEDFFIAASFPDDFESPTLIKKRGTGTPTWDEIHATISEASVKADRGDVRFQPSRSPRQDLEKFIQPDRLEPKMDEM
ncbi:hypothetical protein BDV59DRAFT_203383 [Aspergillus ambiguus]|uniref:uncharacterized protein n=1 Tax=Aspergillus ambiguus TaxID=176160 RepID=UPI003CCDCE09